MNLGFLKIKNGLLEILEHLNLVNFLILAFTSLFALTSSADVPTALQECEMSRMSICSDNPQGNRLKGPCPPGATTIKPYEPNIDCSNEALAAKASLREAQRKKSNLIKQHEQTEALKALEETRQSQEPMLTAHVAEPPQLSIKTNFTKPSILVKAPVIESRFSLSPAGSIYDYSQLIPLRNRDLFAAIEYGAKSAALWNIKTGHLQKVIEFNDCGDIIVGPSHEDSLYCFYLVKSNSGFEMKAQKIDLVTETVSSLAKLPGLSFPPMVGFKENYWFYFDKYSFSFYGWDSGSGKFTFQNKLPLAKILNAPLQLTLSDSKELLLVQSGIWDSRRSFIVDTKNGNYMELPFDAKADWSLTLNAKFISQNGKKLFRLPDEFFLSHDLNVKPSISGEKLELVSSQADPMLKFTRFQNLENDFLSEGPGLSNVHFDKIKKFQIKELLPAKQSFGIEIKKISPDSNWVLHYNVSEDKLVLMDLKTKHSRNLTFKKSGSKVGNADLPNFVFSLDSKNLFLSYKRKIDFWNLETSATDPISFELPSARTP